MRTKHLSRLWSLRWTRGDSFDEQLDKSLPQNRLSEQVDTVSQIARGNMPDDQKLKAMWGTLVRYAALFNKLKDVGSDDNEAKLKDGWKKFVETTK
jgi:hypothetical protein